MITQDTQLFLVLEKNKITRFIKIFKEKDWPKIFVFAFFLLVAFVLSVVTFFFSRSSFFFLKFYPRFLESMVFYILLAWFFLIFILTLGSSLVSALGIFFTQDDDDFLRSCPIRSQIIFESRFINLLILSSWPTIVFGIPLLLAFRESFNLIFLNFILSFLALILILLISSFVAAILALKMISFTGRIGKKIVNLLMPVGLLFMAWWASTILIPPNLTEAFQKLQLGEINQFLRSLPIHSDFFPSTWAVNFIFYCQTDLQLALLNLERMLAFLATLAGFTYWLVNKEYFLDLAQARVGSLLQQKRAKRVFFIAGPHDVIQPTLAKKSFPSFLKGIKGTFLEKDILIFGRNQAEVLQAEFILSLVLLYFLILSKVPLGRLGETLSHLSIDNFIEMNFFFGAYILAILALRFIFPSISLEGQSGWLIWSAPFSKAELFWQKLLTGWGFLSIVSGIVSFLSTLMLKLGLQFFLAHFFILFAVALGITSINLGMGAIFPDFSEKNLEKISTSIGGILATTLSLFYIFVVSLILFPKPSILSILSLAHLSVWGISVALTIFFSFISLFKIEKYQF